VLSPHHVPPQIEKVENRRVYAQE
jgi:hypothetical protein